jgi:hypothetical protein
VVQDDRRVRERARERGDLGDLPVIAPRLERQATPPELGEALPEIVTREEARPRVGAMLRSGRVRVPRGGASNAAEASAARGDLRVEHGADGVAQT